VQNYLSPKKLNFLADIYSQPPGLNAWIHFDISQFAKN